jgi:hypothetical protein
LRLQLGAGELAGQELGLLLVDIVEVEEVHGWE